MTLFLSEHLLQYQLRLAVIRRELLQVFLQVHCHAFLRRVNKAKAHLVADSARECAECVGACKKKRIKSASVSAQLVDSFLTPIEVVFLFLCGLK